MLFSLQSAGSAPSAGPGDVDEWFECVVDDLVGEFLGRVLGSGIAAVRDLGHVHRPGQVHGGQVSQVVAEKPHDRAELFGEVGVVVAGDAQPAKAEVVGRLVEEGTGLLVALPGHLGEPRGEVVGTLVAVGFEIGERDFRLGARLADEADGGGFDAAGSVVEETFVDVADLLDVQTAERQPAGFGDARLAHLENLQRREQAQHGAIIDG